MGSTDTRKSMPLRALTDGLKSQLGLLIVAAANLAMSFAATLSDIRDPNANAFFGGMFIGQFVFCGIISAFSCRRPLHGLVWVVGYCTSAACTFWLARRTASPNPVFIGRAEALWYLAALTTFVILLGWRVFFGGRFETDPKWRYPTVVQFRLSDVLAWMFAFAFALGLNSLFARKGVTHDVLAPYLAWLTLGLLIAVPWSLTIFSRPNWKWVLLLVGWTPVASVATILLADGIPRPWYIIIGAAYLMAGILGIILVNSAVLRWFGFHWNRLMLTLVHVPSWQQQLRAGLNQQFAHLPQKTRSDNQ